MWYLPLPTHGFLYRRNGFAIGPIWLNLIRRNPSLALTFYRDTRSQFENHFNQVGFINPMLTFLLVTVALLFGNVGKKFALNECPSDRRINPWANCFAVYTYPNGESYVGEC